MHLDEGDLLHGVQQAHDDRQQLLDVHENHDGVYEPVYLVDMYVS